MLYENSLKVSPEDSIVVDYKKYDQYDFLIKELLYHSHMVLLIHLLYLLHPIGLHRL